MSAYFLACIDIRDREGYARYLAGTDRVLEDFGGEVLAVDDAVGVLEGTWLRGRTVLIRFPDEVALGRWYDSPAYRHLLEFRRAAAESDAVVLHGRPVL